MSRWLVAGLVDLSIIATAAVSALPMEAMEQLWVEFALDGKVPISKVIHVKNYEIQPLSNVTNNTKNLEFADLVPNGDNVAGTLIFMGA
jgi:chorismate-pyruvate lyase